MDMNEVFQALHITGRVCGELGGKRLFLMQLPKPRMAIMVALENDGCYVVEDPFKMTFDTDLMGAGFDFLTAPAVARVLEAYREWLGRDLRDGAMRLLENDT